MVKVLTAYSLQSKQPEQLARRFQRLVKIGLDILDMFQTHGHADEFGRHARGALGFYAELLMRGGGRMEHQGLGIAYIGQVAGQLERIDKPLAGLASAPDAKA